MKKLLILARHAEFVEAVKAAFLGQEVSLSLFAEVEEAEPLLVHGLADLCIVDGELASVPPTLLLEKITRRAPNCPVVLYLGPAQRGEEEQAYLRGASQVLEKPVRPRLLAQLANRLLPISQPEPRPATAFFTQTPPAPAAPLAAGNAEVGNLQEALRLMRGFSAALSNQSDTVAMVNQFLWQVRDTFSLGRCAIFLRSQDSQESQMRATAAVGVAPGLLQTMELSTVTGVGAFVTQSSRIARWGAEARMDAAMAREFEVLGMEVALPIMHSDGVLGVTLLDRRITGEGLSNAELEVIYRYLEQLGLALHNAHLQTALLTTNELVTGVLREISSACVVVKGEGLAILHANKRAQEFFLAPEDRHRSLSFTDLPRQLAEQVYKVLKTGAAAALAEFTLENRADKFYSANIVPFQRKANGLPESALIVVEDKTQEKRLHREEARSKELQKITYISGRLAAEIGNASLPVTLIQDSISKMLASNKLKLDVLRDYDPTFGRSVRRIKRRSTHLRYIGEETSIPKEDRFPVKQLIEEALSEARDQMEQEPAESLKFDLEPAACPVLLSADREALRTALAEVMLNALQAANKQEPRVTVRLSTVENGTQKKGFEMEVRDNGEGFTPEALQHAGEPFYTTRTVGLGLGLAVTRKILDRCRGRLEIVSKPGKPGVVRISLPGELISAA